MRDIPWMGLIGLGILMATVSGCNTTRASQRPPEPMAVVRPQPVDALSPKKGSIWHNTDRNTLFLDNKARNVGDIVMVAISETSSANKSATTDLTRENTTEASLGTLFGVTSALQAHNPNFDGTANLSGKNEYKGEGSTTRRGDFTATVSCVVTEVLANGNLRIEGRRDITVNNENQFIILSGVVRPEDITHSNMVRSTQIADARIEYSGDGDIDDQQRPGWLNQILAAFRIL